MSLQNPMKEDLISLLDKLPEEKISQIKNFVDFLLQRDQDRHLSELATKISEKSFNKIWDNPEDAAYDKL